MKVQPKILLRKIIKIILIILALWLVSIIFRGCQVFNEVSRSNIAWDKVDSKFQKIQRLVFCKEKLDQKDSNDPDNYPNHPEAFGNLAANYQYQINKGYCPEREILKNFETDKLKLCEELKVLTYKAVEESEGVGADPVRKFYRYIGEGYCPESLIDESEKIAANKAKIEFEKVRVRLIRNE